MLDLWSMIAPKLDYGMTCSAGDLLSLACCKNASVADLLEFSSDSHH
jgi:hypothetical protein